MRMLERENERERQREIYIERESQRKISEGKSERECDRGVRKRI